MKEKIDIKEEDYEPIRVARPEEIDPSLLNREPLPRNPQVLSALLDANRRYCFR